MARITIELDDALLKRLKTLAAKEHRTLKDIFTELLMIGLHSLEEKKKSK